MDGATRDWTSRAELIRGGTLSLVITTGRSLGRAVRAWWERGCAVAGSNRGGSSDWVGG